MFCFGIVRGFSEEVGLWTNLDSCYSIIHIFLYTIKEKQTKITLKEHKNPKEKLEIHNNNFTCPFSVHSTVSLSRHEQLCLIRLCLERYFSYPWEKYFSVSLKT